MNWHMIFTRGLASLTVALAACGGGGGDAADAGAVGSGSGGAGGSTGSGGSTGTGAGTGTTAATGLAYGGIEGFGSVWVNGVRYDTSNASFRRDGSTIAQSDLRVGMVARVQGSSTSSAASLVSVDSAVKGRVEQVQGGNFVVMGQTVQTDAGTVFDSGARPAAGDYIEAHGLPRAAGVIEATYIERKSTLASPPFVVTGFVSGQNTAASTLVVGSLTVAYAGAEVGDMPTGSWVGKLVEIKGSACAGSPVCGSLTASRIEPAGPRISSSPKAEVEGFVSALAADGFLLGAQRVVVSAGTRYRNGLAGDLIVGTKLEAEGAISNGVLTASEISFKAGARLEADVLQVSADRITLAGLPGITVQVTSQTRLDGLGSLGELRAGDHVRLRGRPVGSALVVATELDRRSTDADVELRGSVSSAANPVLIILGVSVDTANLSDSAFRNGNVVIGRTAFFAALTNGRAAKISGTRGSGGVAWRELELED